MWKLMLFSKTILAVPVDQIMKFRSFCSIDLWLIVFSWSVKVTDLKISQNRHPLVPLNSYLKFIDIILAPVLIRENWKLFLFFESSLHVFWEVNGIFKYTSVDCILTVCIFSNGLFLYNNGRSWQWYGFCKTIWSRIIITVQHWF